jgi:hypothetical protein
MSTKIYNGLILRSCTLEQALGKLRGIREQCVQAGRKATAALVAERLVFNCDMAQNYCEIPPEQHRSDQRGHLNRNLRFRSQRTNQNRNYLFISTLAHLQ